MDLPAGDTHFEPYAKQGFYQDETLADACAFVTDFTCAVDVGAHVGFWSKPMVKRFMTVYAFEPIDDNVDCLLRNVPSNAVKVYAMALGDRDNLIGMANPCPENSGAWRTKEGLNIEKLAIVRTLDSFGLSNVGLIKIDVQGDEAKVLRGAEQTIRKWRPVLVVEMTVNGQRDPEPERIMLDFGYRMHKRINKDEIWVPT